MRKKFIYKRGIDMVIPVKTALGGYDIVIERGALKEADKYLNLSRKVLIVTDDGVPEEYSRVVADLSQDALTLVISQGEKSKNFDNYKKILETLIGADFTRGDCVVAVGGGVVGDMAGFAAATYMRGIDFYNVPTTLLSQVDSSVGGKTAIDFGGYKNTVGAFYPPKCVLIDPETLSTLDNRQISNGLCEVIKMAATSDKELFSLIEDGIDGKMDEIITGAINIKKTVVEADERETGLRRVLNFGHTIGHAIESNSPELLHGECVGIGMLYMCSGEAKERIYNVLEKYELPTDTNIPFEKISQAVIHDKKAAGSHITFVCVNSIGTFEFATEKTEDFLDRIKRRQAV